MFLTLTYSVHLHLITCLQDPICFDMMWYMYMYMYQLLLRYICMQLIMYSNSHHICMQIMSLHKLAREGKDHWMATWPLKWHYSLASIATCTQQAEAFIVEYICI